MRCFFVFPPNLQRKTRRNLFFAPKRNVCALGRLGACCYELSSFCYSLLFMLLIPYKNRVGGRRGGVKNSSGRFVSTDLGKCVLSTWHLLRRGRVRKFLPQESGIWGVGGLNKYFSRQRFIKSNGKVFRSNRLAHRLTGST